MGNHPIAIEHGWAINPMLIIPNASVDLCSLNGPWHHPCSSPRAAHRRSSLLVEQRVKIPLATLSSNELVVRRRKPNIVPSSRVQSSFRTERHILCPQLRCQQQTSARPHCKEANVHWLPRSPARAKEFSRRRAKQDRADIALYLHILIVDCHAVVALQA